ncbi:MAG: NUDIX hydrolase [Cyclobacteriaceae bacterium]
MLATTNKDLSMFSGKVRVRVCGLLAQDDSILLIKHNSIGIKGHLWAPPGGGVDFGESVDETLKREFLEETGLNIEVLDFLFVFELINSKHHAIELFYSVKKLDGVLKLGADPEFDASNQIMEEISFLSYDEISRIDPQALHGIFGKVKGPEKVFGLRGLFSFKY